MSRGVVQAVIFDMDGVILDSQGLACHAWTRAVQSLGYQLSDELNLELLGRNQSDSDAILRHRLGDGFPVEAARRSATIIFGDLTAADGVPLKSGVGSLLDFLDGRELKKAIATSTPRAACLRHLTRSKLLHRFDATVCGDEVVKGKPAPDIFLQAARLLQIDPASCVVLEDSFAGIRSAYAAGMIPVMVPDLKQPDAEIRALAYRVVPNLDGARDAIATLLDGAPE
jgi:beta-phosphoglucomutase-like phosphatase (HAD superfamily)